MADHLSDHDWKELERARGSHVAAASLDVTLPQFLLSPNGRVSRRGYWLRYLVPYLGLSVATMIVDGVMGFGWEAGPTSIALSLVAIWPGIAIGIKRLHDLDMSAHWLFIPAIMIMVGLLMAVVAPGPAAVTGIGLAGTGGLAMAYVTIKSLFFRGTWGENRFGRAPAYGQLT